MAYVPPHKRRPKEGEGSSNTPPPKPALPPPRFSKNHKVIKSSASASTAQQDLVYAFENIFKWFAVGLDDHNQFPPYVHLQPVSVENDRKILKRLALTNTHLPDQRQ